LQYVKYSAWKKFVLGFNVSNVCIENTLENHPELKTNVLPDHSFLEDVGKKTTLLSFTTGAVAEDWMLAKAKFLHQQQPLTAEEHALVAGAAETALFDSFWVDFESVEQQLLTTITHMHTPTLRIRRDLVAQAQKEMHLSSLNNVVCVDANTPNTTAHNVVLGCSEDLDPVKHTAVESHTNTPSSSSVPSIKYPQTYDTLGLCGCAWNADPPQLCSQNTPTSL